MAECQPAEVTIGYAPAERFSETKGKDFAGRSEQIDHAAHRERRRALVEPSS
jgi:hypothetical protein